MKTVALMAGVVALTLVGAGCATKKYVAKTVSPVEARVSQTEGKNTDQDKQIAGHTTQIEEMDRDMSRTKERLTDVDARANAAGQAAKQAGERADGAFKAADDARGVAEKGLDRTNQLEKNMDAMNRFQVLKEESVLFNFAQSKLTKEAKAQLEEIAKTVDGKQRFVIEVQGFTDHVGNPAYNATLSEERARAVARYLTTEYKIPVRSISLLGVGDALPVGDEKTSEGRKQNRRVDVRVYVPENAGNATATRTSTASNQ